ncbi:bifunctional glutamate N-acetyltransferase/amino-acid acetyltransferase ArgJ [Chordicoccus furentiruminis]|uniref:bifunctional glutamate N-acetyltransferase/amino-acid acetyltransferase ArgJ n=1 Tax=Chordicoccus furentiruminis TaxID=2709410 RepID=UPI0023A85A3D|nr:bifunctional glutamate N-acetyltransferase/amino-acid acetyltransferase ArgJ [Chordicoccus furentiruminis]
MERIEGGVTAAMGFSAAGGAAGIKKNGHADMALLLSRVPCQVAGTFTSNRVKAAPVVWDRAFVEEKRTARAVVVNSGVANACTGKQGMALCRRTADAAAETLAVKPDEVLLASTGVIGQQLPIDRITAALPVLADQLSEDLGAGSKAAAAIMTTDTVAKEAAVSLTFSDGSSATLGGMSKGSGMIHPNMCTMLAFLTTDARISRDMLQKALSSVVPDTFNMISVDGDTSTNDTCLLLSSGLAGNPEITEEGPDYEIFRAGLLEICTALAKKMAADGEGATCLFECDIVHAATKEDAKKMARSVVSSTLTKAAIAGHDANWGRILCAMGYSGAVFDPERVDLFLESRAGRIQILENGVAASYSEEKATEILSQPEIRAIADVKMGEADASAWGCDLTHEYVNINADYRS